MPILAKSQCKDSQVLTESQCKKDSTLTKSQPKNKWLENFAYKIEIGWWVFLLAGGIALIIALLTVSYQAIRAATANPVESLRYE